jgi:O-antigen/teichoic acid export membrane protein
VSVAVDDGSRLHAPSAEERHRRITRDSIVLTASYGLTAVVGVVFWAVAARTVPASRLGVDTAVISAVSAAGIMSATGIANAFLALLPVSGPARGLLLRLGYRVVLVASLVCGVIAGVLTVALLPGMGSPVVTVLAVAAASVIWAFFVVQDPALTALGRAHWLLAENIPVSLAKLMLLPVLAVVAGAAHYPVVLATVAPAALAVVVVSGVLLPRIVRAMRPSQDVEARAAQAQAQAWMDDNRATFGMFVLRDGVASALNLGLFMVLPFVVTATSGAVQGAVFALCLQVAAGLDLLTAGVGVSLTTHVTGDPSAGPVAAIRMWKRLVLLVAAASLVMVAGSPVLLWVFGRTYLHHDGVLIIAVFAVGSVLRTPFEVWIALLRAQRRTGLMLVSTASAGSVLLALVVVLGLLDGALGAAVAVTLGTCLFSVLGALGLARAGRTRPATGLAAGAHRAASR